MIVSTPWKKIAEIKFSLFSPEMIRKMSAVKVTVPDTYDDDGYPLDNGLVDTRMGVVDPGLRCKTCGGREGECPGHFGHIELVRPVIHPHFAPFLAKIVKSVCPHCKSYLGPKPVPKSTKKGEKKTSFTCPECGKEIPIVKFSKPTSFEANGEELLPTELKEWVSGLSDDVIRELGFDPEYARPEWMILTVLPVPPVNVRPSITLESGERSEDDLTHKLVDIIRINQKLEANISAGAPQLIIEDLWNLLQYHVTTFFDNECPNIPPARHRSGRPLKTLAQRLKGKEGRFRYNLSGKRVNFSARTVVSPDPMISINEVGVPRPVAERLSVPVAVTEWNIEQCKQWILNEDYPKALYVIRNDGRRLRVTELTKHEIAEDLKIGSIVERQLVDGDLALFNRQPSLHRISMMGHVVKVLPGRTFRLNPTVTPPYNADFDGDEMNLHIPQNPEAQGEIEELTKVEKQILSPRHGLAIILPQEDYVTGYYFWTKDGMSFDKQEAAYLLYVGGITELPEPDEGDRYSGKLLFSQFLPKDASVVCPSKFEHDMVIKDGLLVEGVVEKKSLAALLQYLFINYGHKTTREFLDATTKVALYVITRYGFTVSPADYDLSDEAKQKVFELNDKMNREIENLILQYKNGTLERAPGMSLRETLESLIMQCTSKTRNAMGKVVRDDLGSENPSLIMATIGARGSILNAIQMAASVGQQAIRNKRPRRGYRKRNLPFFEPGVISAREKGYVFSSFSKGLDPDEFFHHAMGGRESLVNTAIRTARSGYMQRRLINALQDLIVQSDGTVRDAGGKVVQFVYGGDLRDPMYSRIEQVEEMASKKK